MLKYKKLLSLLVLVPALALSVGALKTSKADAATITVKYGDTVSGYAQEFGVSIISIIKSNSNVKNNGNLIIVGDRIYIPTATTQSRKAPVARTQVPVRTPKRTYSAPVYHRATVQKPVKHTPSVSNSGSTYSQFIANGGTPAMWNTIVMPESGGIPNIVSPNGYHGLGQTKQSWGYGSVANQTKGMINYAVSRYGSVNNAISFRQSHGWW